MRFTAGLILLTGLVAAAGCGRSPDAPRRFVPGPLPPDGPAREVPDRFVPVGDSSDLPGGMNGPYDWPWYK